MGKPFKGIINIDIRDSTPDWEPYKIAGEVDLGANPSGVLFAHGSKFGGHALYVKDGKLRDLELEAIGMMKRD